MTGIAILLILTILFTICVGWANTRKYDGMAIFAGCATIVALIGLIGAITK